MTHKVHLQKVSHFTHFHPTSFPLRHFYDLSSGRWTNWHILPSEAEQLRKHARRHTKKAHVRSHISILLFLLIIPIFSTSLFNGFMSSWKNSHRRQKQQNAVHADDVVVLLPWRSRLRQTAQHCWLPWSRSCDSPGSGQHQAAVRHHFFCGMMISALSSELWVSHSEPHQRGELHSPTLSSWMFWIFEVFVLNAAEVCQEVLLLCSVKNQRENYGLFVLSLIPPW